jgi:hypothetical protein
MEWRSTTLLLTALLAPAQGWAQDAPEAPSATRPNTSDTEDQTVDADARPSRRNLADSIASAGTSPRLFDMPVADVIGAYEISLSYDGSLLREPGLLSSAGVAALGIGDLGQVEYRHTSAIGLGGGSVPLPAVGVQFKLPFASEPYMPALAIAYRLGIEHEESHRGMTFREKATDVYGVAHVVLPADIHLHLGLRFTSAILESDPTGKVERTLYLPAVGIARSLGNTTAVIELGRAPLFQASDGGESKIEHGITGRLGLRWRLHPRFSFDASAGYLASESGVAPDQLLEWDIRLGGELFIPWGALACHSVSLFCN